MRRSLALVVLVLVSAGCSAGGAAVTEEAATADPGATGPTSTVATTEAPTAAQPAAEQLPDSTRPTTTSTTTTTLPPKPVIKLGFAGDTSFTHGLDQRDPLGDVTDLLSAPDLMLVNLETTVAEPNVGTRVAKTYTFKSPPHSVGLLTSAGVDGVQLANNHTLDFERPALLRTLELLDEGGLPHAGAGPDADAAYSATVFDVEEWNVALVAFSRVPCDWAQSGENTRPEVAWTCDPFVVGTLGAVQRAAQGADLVVVMVHWGIERDHCPQPYQRDLAEAWIEVGADLVIGGHPHVLQGVERIGDGWLVHSTGNFAFPSAREASARSALFEFTVSESDIRLRAIPIRISDGRPAPAKGDDDAAILRDLSRWSFGFTFDENGRAMPTTEPSGCG
jgi:poly-gamma-glutamate synthesis protein (capsule biosynthesis protein)